MPNIFGKIKNFLFLVGFSLLSPRLASGQTDDQVVPTIGKSPVGIFDKDKSIEATESIVVWMAGIFWVLAVAMVIWAAYLYLTGGDNEDKVKEAKKRLLYAVIAAAIALLANAIDVIVKNILTTGA